MKPGVPWNVKGVRREAVETAREAARRSGMSLGEWLAFVDTAVETGVRPKRRREGTHEPVRQPPPRRTQPPFANADQDRPWHPASPETATRIPPDDFGSHEQAPDPLQGVNQRLDGLTRQLGRLTKLQTVEAPPRRSLGPDEQGSRRLTDAIARLDARLDEVITEGRRASSEIERRVSLVDQTLSSLRAPQTPPQERDWAAALDQAIAEITVRQRELDEPLPPLTRPTAAAPLVRAPAPAWPSAAAPASSATTPSAPAGAPSLSRLPEPPRFDAGAARNADLSGLQRQLEQLTNRMETLRRPCGVEESVAALRADLAEIGALLTEALPRRAIESLEAEVRSLAERLMETRKSSNDSAGFAVIERGLAEVRDALRNLTPAENLVGVNEAVQTLSHKIDLIASANQDPAALQQFETTISGLRSAVSRVASNEALAKLADEVRSLSSKVERIADAAGSSDVLAALERRISTLADAFEQRPPVERNATPQVEAAVRGLADKIDRMADAAGSNDVLVALERRMSALADAFEQRPPVERNATPQVEAVVRGLADKIERIADAQSGDALAMLERRVAALTDAFTARESRGPVERGVGPEIEAVISGLAEKLEQLQFSRGDQGALGHLEDRIVQLVEKLEASDSRLTHVERMERGLAELLTHLEELRAAPVPADTGPAVDMLRREIDGLRETERRTQDTLEAVHGALGHVVDRLAMLETDLRSVPQGAAAGEPAPDDFEPAPFRRAAAPPSARMSASVAMNPPPQATAGLTNPPPPAAARPGSAPAGERRPIDPNLPPDHPLEPGVARGRGGNSPADRIAASEAALGPAKPPVIDDPAPKANFIAAARRAAQSAAAAAREANPEPAKAKPAAKSQLAQRLGKHVKTMLVGASVIVILFGAWQAATNFLEAHHQAAPAAIPNKDASSRAPGLLPDAPPPADKQSSLAFPGLEIHPGPAPAGQGGDITGAIGVRPQGSATASPLAAIAPSTAFGPPNFALTPQAAKAQAAKPQAALPQPRPAPTPALTPVAAEAAPVATAAAPVATTAAPAAPVVIATATPPALPTPVAPDVSATPVIAPVASAAPVPAPAGLPSALLATGKLPTVIGGPALRKAAEDGDPSAEFEVAARMADGRKVVQNLPEAIRWYERAAAHGLPAAAFRLGSMYEKGQGVARDRATARTFYAQAAEKGHAKAMHNLAVLYAEGVDGKPDFKMAAQWFRRAADHGVPDSQYNLGILYARGIGVEQNLAESYKWFALAALQGDTESGKKRDDIAGKLDPQSLTAAKLAAQTFVPDPQPEEATAVKVPPGGWDAPAPEAKSASAAPSRTHHPHKAAQNVQ